MRKKNILIINTVPVNGGDEALLMSTLKGLKDFYGIDNKNINVFCNNPELYKKYIKYVKLDYDIEYVYKLPNPAGNTLLWNLRINIRNLLNNLGIDYISRISQFFATVAEKGVIKKIKKADIILSGAGGYIHDIYGYDKRLEVLSFLINDCKKQVIMFSQSFGPFYKQNSHKALSEILSQTNIITRDTISTTNLMQIGVDMDVVKTSTDIAFYLYNEYKIEQRRKLTGTIVVTFRSWSYEIEDEKLIEVAFKFVDLYLERPGRRVYFLSTCQGIEGYADDSKVAKEIIKKLSKKKRVLCTLDRKKYTLQEYIKLVSSFDMYVGMRLHGAILAMIAGIPAINIGYEEKTKGIYSNMGLQKLYSHFSDNPVRWCEIVDYVAINYAVIQAEIQTAIINEYKKAKNNFKILDL